MGTSKLNFTDNFYPLVDMGVIKSICKMNLSELDVIKQGLVQLNVTKPLDGCVYLSKDVVDIIFFKNKKYGTSRKSRQRFVLNLLEHGISIESENSMGESDYSSFYTHWISNIIYDEKQFSICFSDYVLKNKEALIDWFNINDIVTVNKLSLPYVLRTYEIFKTLQLKQGTINAEFTLDLFKRLLNIEQQYKQFGLLRSVVLDRAMNDIQQYTELDIECIPRKIGSMVTGLQFIQSHTAELNEDDPNKERGCLLIQSILDGVANYGIHYEAKDVSLLYDAYGLNIEDLVKNIQWIINNESDKNKKKSINILIEKA